MLVAANPDQAEQQLLAGALGCPTCPGTLRPHGWARRRTVRGPGACRLVATPRRARCGDCSRTHVILPGELVPRRADAAEVIGAALVAKACGDGWRTIADRCGRPPSTVRRWMRAPPRRGPPRAAAPAGRRGGHPAGPGGGGCLEPAAERARGRPAAAAARRRGLPAADLTATAVGAGVHVHRRQPAGSPATPLTASRGASARPESAVTVQTRPVPTPSPCRPGRHRADQPPETRRQTK